MTTTQIPQPSTRCKALRVSCRVLSAPVGLDYCLTSCRFVCRQAGVCQPFANGILAAGKPELSDLFSRVSITPTAESALIAINAPPTVHVNVPVHTPPTPEDRPMPDMPKPSRTAAANIARLAKLKAKREAAAAAAASVVTPVVVEVAQDLEPTSAPVRKPRAKTPAAPAAAVSLTSSVDTPAAMPEAMSMLLLVETEKGSGIYTKSQSAMAMAEIGAAVFSGKGVIAATEWRSW